MVDVQRSVASVRPESQGGLCGGEVSPELSLEPLSEIVKESEGKGGAGG